MTKEQAIEILRCRTNLGYGIVIENESTQVIEEALDLAIEALEIVEEFEKAQIITGGRLNGRTYAYKCGLEDGKRKALEQQPTQSWIPISERLPEEETTVLICTDQGDIDASRIFSYSDGEWEWFASSWCYGEIIAWMPLPEPYIESEGE